MIKESESIQPLLKWAGGKRAIGTKIVEHIGAIKGRYYEPFFGGGAIFFRLNPAIAVLGDLNEDLMNCYRQIKEQPFDLAKKLSQMENTEENYYKIRNSSLRNNISRAARIIYLTTLSFNGIYRQNLKGKHNVPYGYKSHLKLPDKELISKYSLRLRNCELCGDDFEKTTGDAQCSDVIYFDPPYTVVHNNNGFVKYNDRIFSWADQKRLALFATKLQKRGCKVLISNADHQSIRELYPTFREVIISRKSVIAASSAHRRQITESLFISQ
jgi:DNA adenine methylase